MANRTQQDEVTLKLETSLENATATARIFGFDLGANAATYEFNNAIKSLTNPDSHVQISDDALEQAKLEIGKSIANSLTESTALHNAAVANLGLAATQSLQYKVAGVCIDKNNLPYVPLEVLNKTNEHIQYIGNTYGKTSFTRNEDLYIIEDDGHSYNVTSDCAQP